MSRLIIQSIAAFFLMIGAALAQAPAPAMPTLIPGVELQLTPRFWYSQETEQQLSRPTLGSQSTIGSSSPAYYPMFGGSVSARFWTLPDTSFIFSGLYGVAPITASQLIAGATTTGGSILTLDEHSQRIDLEFLAS